MSSGSHRLRSLRQRLEPEDLDGLLVTHPPNVRYLSGFGGSAGILLVGGDRALLVTDARYGEQAEEEVAEDVEVRVVRDGLVSGLGTALEEAGTTGAGPLRLGVEAHRLTVSRLRELEEEMEDVEWGETTDLVEELRARKDAGEMERLEEAARVASRAFEAVLRVVEEGMTEAEVVAELEFRLRKAGSGPAAFESIVAAGPRSALPHARPSSRRIREGDLLLFDFGATVDGYRSDLTRTVVVGEAAPWQREAHEAVREALEAATSAVAAGRPARDVDARAREILEERGFGDAFTHSTGHGLGLEVHEKPSVSRKSDDILQAGNVVTIEPGVYLRGRGGIRLEDDVAVEEAGARVLTGAPRHLREL